MPGGRKGFGWTRWSNEWLYDRMGQLPTRSMVRCESGSSRIGHITLGTKQTGAPSAGNPHAGCDVAGVGNGFTVWLMRHSQRKRGETARLDLRNTASVLDPTAQPSGFLWRYTSEALSSFFRRGRGPGPTAVELRNAIENSALLSGNFAFCPSSAARRSSRGTLG